MNTSSAFRYFSNAYLNREKGVLIYQRAHSRHLGIQNSTKWKVGSANIESKSLAEKMQFHFYVIKVLEDLWNKERRPKLWKPGELLMYLHLRSDVWRWRPGTVFMATLSHRRRFLKDLKEMQDRTIGLKGLFQIWVQSLLIGPYNNRIWQGLDVALLMGTIAYWYGAPQAIIEMLGPEAILNPELINNTRESLNQGAGALQQAQPAAEGALAAQGEVPGPKAKAFAFLVAALIIGIALNGVGTSFFAQQEIMK